MNEKRQRKLITEIQQQDSLTLNPSENFHVNETPINYLSHTNATSLIKQAVHTLLQNRPDDPIQFLADFFAPTDSSSVDSAYHKLAWAHYSSSVYQRNALQVYDTLTTARNEGTALKGLLGRRFNDLMRRICDDLPQKYTQRIFRRVQKKVDHVITFNTFYRNVLMLHVLKDFIYLAKETFTALDVHSTGRASLKLCNFVLENLFVSVVPTQPTYSFSTIALEDDSSYRNDSDFYKAFSKLFIQNAGDCTRFEAETISEDDFVHACIMKFLEKQ